MPSSRSERCPNCRSLLAVCSESGCGQRRRPGWRDAEAPPSAPTDDNELFAEMEPLTAEELRDVLTAEAIASVERLTKALDVLTDEIATLLSDDDHAIWAQYEDQRRKEEPEK